MNMSISGEEKKRQDVDKLGFEVVNVPNSDWQFNKSVLECNQYMLECQVHCDVVFSIEDKELAAHRYVLMSRSPVFQAMLTGELGADKQSEKIFIPDITYSAFQQFLRYLYYEDVDFMEEDILGIWYASKKYFVPSLTEKCSDYLEDHLSPSNVCLIYEHSILHSAKRLILKCSNFIETRTHDILKDPSFLDITLQCLTRILKFRKLSVKEVDLFSGCIEWSTAECKRKGLEITPENQRQVLGEAFFLLHIPALSIEEFANKVSKTGLLTADEKCLIYDYFLCEDRAEFIPNIKFPFSPREAPMPNILRRFNSYSKATVYSGDCNILKLQCKQNIVLKGLGVSAAAVQESLGELQIAIKQDQSTFIDCLVPAVISKGSDVMHFLLPETVLLYKDVWYTVITIFHFTGEAEQGTCKRGKGGNKTYEQDGVSFEFDRADSAGFIVEVLFCNM